MRLSMLIRLLAALAELVSADMLRAMFVALVDAGIKFVEHTETKVDDSVLPILRKIREIIGAPEKTE